MLRRLYDWTMDLASRKNAVWALCAVAFVESSVFPIPPDILLVPMILAARDKAWRCAAMCTAPSEVLRSAVMQTLSGESGDATIAFTR